MSHAYAADPVSKHRRLLLVAGAVLMGLTVIFPRIGLLEWVALVPSLLVILTLLPDRTVRLRRLWGMGFLFFVCYYLVNFHWFLYMYPLDFADLSRPASALVVAVAWLGLSAFQAVGAAFIFPLMGLAARGKRLSRMPLVHPFLFAALWTAWEWFQANSGWSGVPWARLSLGQAELLPLLQSASLLGSYFVTFLLLAVNGLLAYLILHPDRRRLCAILAGALFFGNLGLGGLLLLTHREEGNTVTVAAIQGNMSSHEKWSSDSTTRAMEIYGDYTREAAAAGAELVIWPETAVPSNIDSSEQLRTFVTDLAVECHITLLVGVFTSEENTTREYNSVVAVLPDGTIHSTVYSKRNLVPFGEFVPFRELVMTLIPPLAEIGMLGEDLLTGDASVTFDLPSGEVGSLICFDSIYETNALEGVRNGAELLAVSTNDSWFKDSRGVWMHNAQSQLRAIETGRYVVRAANTGVSSIITPTGEVKEELGALLEGYVLGEVCMEDTVTLYTVIGNLFAYMCVAFGGAWVVLAVGESIAPRRKRDKNVKST